MTDRQAEVGGPRAWVVLLATVAGAAILLGGVLGYRAWRDDTDDDADPTSSTKVIATAVGEPGENQLLRRTTGDGIEVRARLTDSRGGVVIDVAPGAAAGEPSGERPAWCNVVGDLMAWAIAPESVVQGGAPWTEAVPDGLYPGLMWDGAVDADSVLGVVAQVGADIESVRLTGPGGAVDEMAPVDGAVVLAIPVPAEADFDPWSGRGGNLQDAGVTVVATRADGSTVGATAEAMIQGHPAWNDPRCIGNVVEGQVPTSAPVGQLPEPGVEQPADPAAARAEIETTFGSLYGPRNPDADQLIDDPYGLDIARQQIDANGFGDDAEGASVAIHDVVFPTATDAVFRYTLSTPVTEFPDQIGRARLIDGVWKITRATLCQDMAKAGATCPP